MIRFASSRHSYKATSANATPAEPSFKVFLNSAGQSSGLSLSVLQTPIVICLGEKTIYTSSLGNARSLTLLKEYSVDVDRELISQPGHFQLKSTGT